jgi:hypothetical protein
MRLNKFLDILCATIMGAVLGIMFWCSVFNIDLVTIIKRSVDNLSTCQIV